MKIGVRNVDFVLIQEKRLQENVYGTKAIACALERPQTPSIAGKLLLTQAVEIEPSSQAAENSQCRISVLYR